MTSLPRFQLLNIIHYISNACAFMPESLVAKYKAIIELKHVWEEFGEWREKRKGEVRGKVIPVSETQAPYGRFMAHGPYTLVFNSQSVMRVHIPFPDTQRSDLHAYKTSMRHGNVHQQKRLTIIISWQPHRASLIPGLPIVTETLWGYYMQASWVT